MNKILNLSVNIRMNVSVPITGRTTAHRLLSTKTSFGKDVQMIFDAYERIRPFIPKSPMDYSTFLSNKYETQIYLKKEHISRVASYKQRGALNKLLLLTDEEKSKGVVCSSAGNHAQAVSFHGTRLGIDSVICMPVTTPHVKVESTRKFGGKVELFGENYDEAYRHAMQIAEKEGRTFIHPFNDIDVMAGQGTVALEMIEQNPYLDAVIIPVGGGGLIGGMTWAIKAVNPRIKIYGVECQVMPGMRESLKAGKVSTISSIKTIADGIAVQSIGDIPFEVLKGSLTAKDIVLVEEEEIATAVLTLLEKEKTLVEGAGAGTIAALDHLDLKNKKVGCVLSGGNIDMTLLGKIIEKGLVGTGRMCRIKVTLIDVPGQLSKANIRDIEHRRTFLLKTVHYAQPMLTLETRDDDHVQEILSALREAGFDDCSLVLPDT